MTNISTKTGLTAGAGLGLAPVIVWIAGLCGVEIPGEVAAALAGLLALAVAYFVPARSGKYVENPDQDWDREAYGSMSDYSTEIEPVTSPPGVDD